MIHLEIFVSETWSPKQQQLGLGDILVYSPPLALVSNEFVIDNVIGYL